MALPWFHFYTDIPDGPEIARLAEALDEPLAGWYAVRLWTYGCQQEDWVFSTAKSVERAAGWHGKPGKLVEALLASGVLERREEPSPGEQGGSTYIFVTPDVCEWVEAYDKKRKGDNLRQSRKRSRRHGPSHAVTHAVTDAVSHAPRGEEMRGEETREEEEAAKEAAASRRAGVRSRDGAADVFSKPVADAQRAIESLIGKELIIPKSAADRSQIQATFSQWIEEIGQADVVKACVAFVKREADAGKSIASMHYLATAMYPRVLDMLDEPNNDQ